jgi:pimeloyl-ACP methyl ester carboxylesterase
MYIATCRNPQKPTKFGDNPFTWIDTDFRENTDAGCVKDLVGYISHGAKRAIVLVHGYNSSPSDVEDAFKSIAKHLKSNPQAKQLQVAHGMDPANPVLYPFEVVGFSWPSNGKIRDYLPDRAETFEAAKRLNSLVESLYTMGFNHVDFIAHSMGNKIVAEMIVSHLRVNYWSAWVAMGADIWNRRLCSNGRYGKHALKIRKLGVYYSKHDNVLRFVAPLVIPVARAGRWGLPNCHTPQYFYQFDSNEIGNAPVGHSDYKNDAKILEHALTFIYQ